jgi:flagellar M-ring protein FliF
MTPATASPGAEQSNSRSDATTYAVSKTLHRSVQPPGRVRRIAAAVLVDDAVEVDNQGGKRVTTRRKRTPEEMKELEKLAQAAIGIDAQRGDLLAVENLSFQSAPEETISPPGKSEYLRRTLQPWTWALRYVGLAALFLVVYWLVLRPVKNQALAAFRQLPGRVTGQLAPATGGTALGDTRGTIEGGENRASQLKRLLSEKVKAEPESASRLVQSWVQVENKR